MCRRSDAGSPRRTCSSSRSGSYVNQVLPVAWVTLPGGSGFEGMRRATASGASASDLTIVAGVVLWSPQSLFRSSGEKLPSAK